MKDKFNIRSFNLTKIKTYFHTKLQQNFREKSGVLFGVLFNIVFHRFLSFRSSESLVNIEVLFIYLDSNPDLATAGKSIFKGLFYFSKQKYRRILNFVVLFAPFSPVIINKNH